MQFLNAIDSLAGMAWFKVLGVMILHNPNDAPL